MSSFAVRLCGLVLLLIMFCLSGNISPKQMEPGESKIKMSLTFVTPKGQQTNAFQEEESPLFTGIRLEFDEEELPPPLLQMVQKKKQMEIKMKRYQPKSSTKSLPWDWEKHSKHEHSPSATEKPTVYFEVMSAIYKLIIQLSNISVPVLLGFTPVIIFQYFSALADNEEMKREYYRNRYGRYLNRRENSYAESGQKMLHTRQRRRDRHWGQNQSTRPRDTKLC